MDEHDLRRALMERSEAPSVPFRAGFRATLLQGRPARPVVPWIQIVAVVLLVILPIAVLLTSRSLSRSGATRLPQTTTANRIGLPLKVSMTGAGHGWAVLAGPASVQGSFPPVRVARTVDSGATWDTVRPLGPGLVDYLQALDDRDVLLLWQAPGLNKGVSGQASLLSTTDAGRSWQSEPVPNDSPPFAIPRSAVSFISPKVGWMLADQGIPSGRTGESNRVLLHTTDGGASWESLGALPSSSSVRFVDSQNGWLGGSVAAPGQGPDLRRTHDGGHTWQSVPLKAPPASAKYPGITSFIDDVQPVGSSTVAAILEVVAGSMGVGSPEAVVVYLSSDGGATWSSPVQAWSGPTALTGRPAISIASDRSWAVAVGNQVASSADGGSSWRTAMLPLPTSYEAQDIQFTDESHGYVLAIPLGQCFGACAGVLLATADGGRTWHATSPTGGDSQLVVTPSATSPSPEPMAPQYLSRCGASQLTLNWGGRTSEKTQQETLQLVFTNTSSRGCYLYGYPGVLLVDSSGAGLPLQYLRTGDQMVTSAPPQHVDLAPGGKAYVTANKTSCQTVDLIHATAVRVIPPDEYTQLQVSIAGNVPMDYCGPGDPGSVLHISPVEPTFTATLDQG